MKDEKLKARLKEAMINDMPAAESAVVTSQPNIIIEYASRVMDAYQKANKWLDIIKETLLMDQGCVFFSNYIHELAHTMPTRFDKFGDILHTIDIKIPYPATEYIDKEPSDIPETFSRVYSILGEISKTLDEFAKYAEESGFVGASIATEDLIKDIEQEYTTLRRMNRAYVACEDRLKFDKWVNQYLNNVDKLI